MKNGNPTTQELIAKITELENKLAKTEWLHEKENLANEESYTPFYGDVTELNTERTILDTVGKEMLKILTSDLMDLLDTSVAIYEKNGDYALGVFSSGWCQLLDASSRKLCETDDNKVALNCGKWLCHDDCWKNSAKVAMHAKKSTDIDCVGGIKLYGEPIFADNESIGAINLGYGNPPTDDKTLKELAGKYNVDFETLKQKALAYKPRPDFIIEIAKKRLKSIAKLIGEIVSRKKVEEQLFKSKTILNEAEYLADVGSFEYDINNNQFTVSKGWQKIHGINKEVLSMQELLPIAHPDEHEKIEKALNKALINGTSYSIEHRIIRQTDNEIRTVKASGKAVFDEQGKPYKMYGSGIDITERKRKEEVLKRSEEKYRSLFENIDYEVHLWEIIKNENGQIKTWKLADANPKALKAWSKSREQVIGKTPDEIFGVEATKQFMPIVKKIFKKGKPCRWEEYFPPTNQYLSMDSVPLGNFFLSTGRDVSREKEMELKLKAHNKKLSIAKEKAEESEEKWKTLVKTIPDWVAIVDKENRFVFMNHFAEGFDENNVIGVSVLNFILGSSKQEFAEALNKTRVSGKVQAFEHLAYGSNKSESFYHNFMVPLDLEKGNILIISRDITDRKKTELALQESKLFADKIANILPALVYIYDFEKEKNIWTNDVHKRYFNKITDSYPDMDFNNIAEIIHKDDFPEVLKKSQEIENQTENDSFELDIRVKSTNDKWKWMNLRVSAFKRNEEGKLVQSLGALFDISERKEIEEKLVKSEERYRSLIENIPVGIFRSTSSGKIISANPEMAEIYGFESTQDLLNTDAHNFYSNTNSRHKMLTDLKEKGFLLDYVTEERKKDGSKVWVSSNYRLIESNELSNNEFYVDGVSFDITEKKRAQEEIDKQQKEFQTWIQNTPVCTKKIDLDFNLQFMSEAGIRELKVDDVNELIGNPYPFYFFPDPFKKTMAAKMKEVKEKGEIMQIDGILADTKGNQMWYNHILVPVNDKNGRLDYILIISTDISERKNAEEELIKAKEKAEEADRLKSAFLANMSHEIRTPMNGILGFTSLLQEDGLTGEEQKEYIDIIQKSGNRMLNTVNDIIEISKIETGQIKVFSTEVNVSEHLLTLHKFFILEADKKGLKLLINNGLLEEESRIITDKNKLSSILTNLIKNALKFTKKGNIEIGCKKNDEFMEFYVKDTGIGIPADRQMAIFNRFEQADIEDKHVHEGSGLGLAIVKSYVEMLGGTIWVESEENKGSIFFFTISCKPANKATVKKNSNKKQVNDNSSGFNILIVEDDDISSFYLTTILKDKSNNIQIVKDGLEAIEICRENSNFDLILMDLKIPGINGLEASKKIRENNKRVKIIAQTAHALEGDREKAIEAGCDDYISKPIDKEKLFELIDKHLKIK